MKKFVTLIGFAVVIFVPFAIYGYINNIAKLSKLDFEKPYEAEVLRAVGIIPPIGIVMGYIKLEEEK